MINNPIISICIPTYNRADFLKICINNIINQDAFSENKIEIVISDNNSPDNTYEVVKTFQKNYSNIKYFKNHENIWANLNLFKVSEYAIWEYIWFMWDDDEILNWWLKNVLNSIKSCNNVVFFQTNSLNNLDETLIINDWVKYFKKLIKINKITNLVVFLLFLSMVIVKRENFIENLNIYKKEFPNKLSEAYSHFYILIRTINNNKIALLWKIVTWWEWEENNKHYFKNNSKVWYDLVIVNWIDKIYDDINYLNSIWITKKELDLYKFSFTKVYYLNIFANFFKFIWLYKPAKKLFINYIKKYI